MSTIAYYTPKFELEDRGKVQTRLLAIPVSYFLELHILGWFHNTETLLKEVVAIPLSSISTKSLRLIASFN